MRIKLPGFEIKKKEIKINEKNSGGEGFRTEGEGCLRIGGPWGNGEN